MVACQGPNSEYNFDSLTSSKYQVYEELLVNSHGIAIHQYILTNDALIVRG